LFIQQIGFAYYLQKTIAELVMKKIIITNPHLPDSSKATIQAQRYTPFIS